FLSDFDTFGYARLPRVGSQISAADSVKCELVHTWRKKCTALLPDHAKGRRTMRNWRQRSSRIVLLMAAWTIASLASSAHAAVTVTRYAVIQPIDVCATNGAMGGCAPFNTSSQSPDPSTAISTTPIGWVDTASQINLPREIWLQAGIDVTFLP